MKWTAVVLLLLLCAIPAWSGEIEVYLKSGYFDWTETVEDSTFIKEKGVLSAIGASYTGNVAGPLDGKGVFEVWGGNVDYDGYRVEDWTKLETNTVYIGTREELYAILKFPLTPAATIGPLAGVGHKFWNRSRSSEKWNTVYGRLGGRVEYDSGIGRVFAEGGLSFPFFTSIHTDWSDYDYKEFVTNPKGLLASFAEAGIMLSNHLSIGAYFEEMNFGQSDKVFLNKVNAPSGVVQLNSYAFQPKSESWTAGIKIGYGF